MSSRPSLLFVTDSVPTPPRSGTELPASRLLPHFAEEMRVDLLVLSSDGADFLRRQPNVPPSVRHTSQVPLRGRPLHTRMYRELAGVAPAFSHVDFAAEDLPSYLSDTRYSYAWVTPIGSYGFLRAAIDEGLLARPRYIALGLNDVTTTLYLGNALELFRFRGPTPVKALSYALRLPWIWHHERSIARQLALVHVQTHAEARRVRKILRTSVPRVVVAPNGVKSDLLGVVPDTRRKNRILYPAHQGPHRPYEYRWVVRRFWPRLAKRYPGLELIVLGVSHSLSATRVRPLGYVDSLEDLYRSVDCVVLPTFKATGLNNRLLDALASGLPVVATPQALSTIPGLVPNHHALSARSLSDFVSRTSAVIEDEDLRRKLSHAARRLASKHPSWDQTAADVLAALKSLGP